ncbi:hypothetical protein [Methylosinus sp. KRF6]|uniref:COG3904 family protein n=1 Tax=Methylosinus sp. KRF6 TaxID=2846853 RepID=UPI001C0E4C46|nr:hypothetical protein [Methylosinus sp. KRF6]MBU3887636.1 hypothetical protein [Methylosinus sp. KRF6]
MAENDILIEGEIVSGDARSFERVVRDIGRHVDKVILRSPGGSVQEAITIGRLVRKLMIETEGPDFSGESEQASCQKDYDHPNAPCVCASACFLIYAGGFPRSVSHVMLHRPFVSPSTNALMSFDESIRAAEGARNSVAEYLHEMGVPDRYANVMFSTPSNAAVLVPQNEMLDYIAGYPIDVEEWLMAQCQTTTTGQAARQFVEENARDGRRATIKNQAIRRGLIREICIMNSLKPKRDAVRHEWFGPITSAEKAKHEMEKLKFESLTQQAR